MTVISEFDENNRQSSVGSCPSIDKSPLPMKVESISLEFNNSTYIPSSGLEGSHSLDDEALLNIEMMEDVSFRPRSPLRPDLSFGEEEEEETTEGKIDTSLNLPMKQDRSSSCSEESMSSESDETTRLKLRDFLMIMSTFFIALIAKGNSAGLSVLTVEWLKQFENSKALILYVPALNFAITSAAGVIDGILINRFGISRIILFGTFLQVFCMIGSSFSPNAITLVIVLGLLAGLGNCFLFVNAFIFVGVNFGKAAKSIIAFLSIAGPLGGLIFPNLIPIFIELFGWRGSMFILAGINLQVVPLGLFLTFAHKTKKSNEDVCPENRNTCSPRKLLDLSVLKDLVFVMYVLSVGLTVGGVNSVFSMLPDFLCEKGLSLKDAAKIYAIYYILSAVPRILIGFAMKYTNVNFIHIYIMMASLFGLTMALMNLAESYVVLLICCCLWALWMGCPAGLYAIGILEIVGPEKHSSGQSIVETCYGLTTALFGFLAGLLVQYTDSYRQPFYIYGIAIVVINIGLLAIISAQQLKLKCTFSKIINK